jgi:hypothetical protein
MKNIISIMALVTFLFAVSANAQEVEPTQKKKEKTKKECKVNGKKCCSSSKEEKACTGKASEEKAEDKKACDTGKKGGCNATKKE